MKASFLALLGLAGAMALCPAADLTGKVVLKGTPPPEKTVDLSADPKCGALHSEPVTTRHYLVGPDGGLANVFVYLKTGVEQKEYPMPTETPILDQANCLYEPYVMGLRVNQKFKIRNSDPTLHNVHATPKAGSSNKEFNFAQPIKGMTSEKALTSPEVLMRFKCDVHPWMFAYIGVLDHPFFAVTTKDGTFKIPNVPPGKYVVEAYHIKTHGQNPGVSQEIAVDGDAKADFTIELK